nr:hypothetical protein [uncultured Cohaesibacter sp.]
MSAPDLSNAALDALRPTDLSTQAFRPSSFASGTYASRAAASSSIHSDQAGLFSIDFSIESIPVVGDFFSMVSSLFSSFGGEESTAQGSADAQIKPLSTMGAPLEAFKTAKAADSSAPLDLTAFLEGLDRSSETTNTPSLLQADKEDGKTDVIINADGSEHPLPPITGLAHHPANKIPTEMLAKMQARYLEMTSKED